MVTGIKLEIQTLPDSPCYQVHKLHFFSQTTLWAIRFCTFFITELHTKKCEHNAHIFKTKLTKKAQTHTKKTTAD